MIKPSDKGTQEKPSFLESWNLETFVKGELCRENTLVQFNVVSQHRRGLEQNEVGVRQEYPIRFQASKISRDKESIIDKETQISGSDIKT